MSTVSEQRLRDIIVFAVLTGLRRGEIVNLRWKDVIMDNRTLEIETNPSFKSKQGRRRVIPLNDNSFYLVQSRFGKATPEYVSTPNGGRSLTNGLPMLSKRQSSLRNWRILGFTSTASGIPSLPGSSRMEFSFTRSRGSWGIHQPG